MKLNWLQSILYGFISGFSELLPVSSHGHRSLLFYIFGAQNRDPLGDLICRIGILAAIVVCFRKQVLRLYLREGSTSQKSSTPRQIYFERRLIHSATIPLVVGILLCTVLVKRYTLIWVAAGFFFNGLILYLTEHLRFGDKNAKLMTRFDSLLIGVGGALAALPGLSGIGGMICAGVARGADKRQCTTWAILLLIPTVLCLSGVDFVALFTGAQACFSFFGYLLAGVAAFGGAYVGIKLMLYLMVQIGISSFAYYSWGAALFTLILYLMT